ncbi:MAG: T9SS type A sorting domain-containing protein [Saprospiraceae bacterium]|nr:T9SS type A sorting domain-containing protein [Saprospiraceae bacterium]
MNPFRLLRLTIAFFWMVGIHGTVWSQCAQGVVTLTGFTASGGQGTYSDPATGNVEINFCFTLTHFFESNTNWVHGIFVAWDNLPQGAIVCEGLTGSQDAQHGSRKWKFIDSASAVNFDLPGAGFYVDEGDGNPKNNYGDNGIGTPNASFPDLEPFCFKVKINCGSTPPIAYVPKIVVTGDGTTGGWTNIACMGDMFRATEGGPNGNGAVVVCGVVLPVKLLAFKGESKPEGNLIEWTASSDHLFSHFELEKSSTNTSAFSYLDKIDVRKGSTGSSNEIFNYSYLDKYITPFAAYRLKMLEKDGTYKFSQVITIRKSGQTKHDVKFSVYPNPAQDRVLVKNETDNRYGQIILNFYDVYGRKINSQLFSATLAKQEYYIELSNFNKGLYFIEVMNGDMKLEGLSFLKL